MTTRAAVAHAANKPLRRNWRGMAVGGASEIEIDPMHEGWSIRSLITF
ncbi:hypothetical protein DB30_01181 [Enhygromyxa salina]|uniref:Uncharacterized protein n=1 Tax=Enhygromyxa salina TaxID=215803 RepID=A0A0C2CMZ4_9BACT|nr:hypothetical protein [Enhygromyxa salina]KIG12616.1 hypothetical protein DB30_01181 [Enhygromyxa salina]